MLDDHGRVQARAAQPLAQPPHPALDLGGWGHVAYRNPRMILHNGPVYTMDPRLPRVSALAVAGGQIAGGVDVREGDTDTVGHERIDLEGRCVVPGFTDAHVHFLEWALPRTQLDLRGCGSKAEALRRVAEAQAARAGCAGAAGSRCAGRTARPAPPTWTRSPASGRRPCGRRTGTRCG